VATLAETATDAETMFRRKNDADLSAEWQAFTNRARRSIMREFNFAEMEAETNITFVNGQRAYTVPTDFIRFQEHSSAVRVVKNSDGSLISIPDVIDKDVFNRLTVTTVPPGSPVEWVVIDETVVGLPLKVCIYAKEILIFPTVTDSALISSDRLRVDYYKILPDLSAGQSDAFTTTFFDATIYRTLMEGALFIQDEDLFDFYKEFFRDQISNAFKATIDEKYSGRLLEMGGHR
jgi:hypothetical protein